MKIDILTLFPESFENILNISILKRAREKGLVEIQIFNIRDFSHDKHKRVDDYPYGGGTGLVLKPEPLFNAIEHIKNKDSKVIYLSPQGKVYNQKLAYLLSKEKHLILLCGHYEGVDQRVIDHLVDEEISIGDYILTGGELPAMVLIDSIVRLIPGVLGSFESIMNESFSEGLLEYPQYTRPRVYRDLKVPEILLSGNHGEIKKWRRKKAIEKTFRVRPELMSDVVISQEEIEYLKELFKDNFR